MKINKLNKNVISSFKAMLDVNLPIIYIEDFDFVRVDEIIKEVAGTEYRISEWNPGVGKIDRTAYPTKCAEPNGLTLKEFLQEIYAPQYELTNKLTQKRDAGLSAPAIYVLREIQDFIEEPDIKTLLALISQRHLYEEGYNRFVVISSSVRKVPIEIEKYVSFLDTWPMPSSGDERKEYLDQVDRIMTEHCDVNNQNMQQEDREALMGTLTGMTPFEIDRVIDMAMSSNGTLNKGDTKLLQVQKKTMVKQSGVLELIDVSEKPENIGGMTALKEYLTRKASIFDDIVKAEQFGVDVPKGVFIVGMPGCGKSLCAKASSAIFHNIPLLKLDMGSLMGMYVGQSEANLRKAIKIAEAVAPSVLWIDEIEKAFSGVNNDNDGMLRRMFGYFLSWMQDKTSRVYVVATANNAENLPPELKRKGRFDEIFCVNLPEKDERKAIFEIHLKKRNKNGRWSESEIKEFAKAGSEESGGFNGADIESAVNESVEEYFLRKGEKDVSYKEILLTKVKHTISITKSCGTQINKMKEAFAENSFKDATSGKMTQKKK